MTISLNQISEALLMAVKRNESQDDLLLRLKEIKLERLTFDLKYDAYKIAFWINIYNAFYQILIHANYVAKSDIHTSRTIQVAGHFFSLDDIEHGILRRFKHKKTMGYLPDLFTLKLIRTLAVSKIDYRIHFALNCGAKSCPPIAFYHPDTLNLELKRAMVSFLSQETQVDHDERKIKTTRLLFWYLNDFGGRKGIRHLLKEYLGIHYPKYKMVFNTYHWDTALRNFSFESSTNE